jgi:hypothetical protein
MYRILFLACLVALLTASCSVTGPARTEVIDTSCNWVKPIILTRADLLALDDATKQAILTHNKTWKANCGTVTQ